MAESTRVAEFFDSLEGKLAKRRKELAGISGLFLFRIGDAPRWLKLSGGEASVGEGEPPSPDCVVTLAEDAFLDLLDGRLSPQTALFSGRIRIAGNFALAMHLGSLVRR